MAGEGGVVVTNALIACVLMLVFLALCEIASELAKIRRKLR
jgi:hypothetical protein